MRSRTHLRVQAAPAEPALSGACCSPQVSRAVWASVMGDGRALASDALGCADERLAVGLEGEVPDPPRRHPVLVRIGSQGRRRARTCPFRGLPWPLTDGNSKSAARERERMRQVRAVSDWVAFIWPVAEPSPRQQQGSRVRPGHPPLPVLPPRAGQEPARTQPARVDRRRRDVVSRPLDGRVDAAEDPHRAAVAQVVALD